MTVLSVIDARDNGTLIAEAASLWIAPGDVVLDMTFGKGNWWTKTEFNIWTNDIDPSTGADWNHDFRSLPEDWSGIYDVACFDPAYIPQGGRDTSTLRTTQSLGMLERYGLVGVAKTPQAMNEDNAKGVHEAARVLRPHGRLLLKCMDYINSGAYHSGYRWAAETADSAGLELADVFVHHSGTGPQPKFNRDGTPRRQVHSRRAHSYLMVFLKGKS